VCGDGEVIPAPTASFWGCTVAFGVRNLSRTLEGLREMHRILRPGGRLLILEFSRPTNPVIKPVYTFYLNRVLPAVAGLISVTARPTSTWPRPSPPSTNRPT
jgi:demethylmenaquinone methyltransferase (EC 2.1.1.-)